MPLMHFACPSAGSFSTAGSATLRHTDVFDRIAGSAGRKSIHGVRATQSAITLAVASARGATAPRPPADPAPPRGGRLRRAERVKPVLDAQHGWRVDGSALENLLVDLAALGQAENLRDRPGR